MVQAVVLSLDRRRQELLIKGMPVRISRLAAAAVARVRLVAQTEIIKGVTGYRLVLQVRQSHGLAVAVLAVALPHRLAVTAAAA